MRKPLLLIALLCLPVLAAAQTGVVQNHSFLGGKKVITSGTNSTNYSDGIIPGASITVYLTGTTTKATITTVTGGVLANPFFSNAATAVDPGGYVFRSATNIGLDVVASGGGGDAACTIQPNCYATPVTLLVDVYPTQSFNPVTGGCSTISDGGHCVSDNPTVSQIITQPAGAAGTQFGFQDVSTNGLTFTSDNPSTYADLYAQISKQDSFTPSDDYSTCDLNWGGLDCQTYPQLNAGGQYQHVVEFDNSGTFIFSRAIDLETDDGGNITLSPGNGPNSGGTAVNSSSIELLGNITFAGGGGGTSGTCEHDGKLCSTQAMDWLKTKYAGYTVFNLDATSAPFTLTLGVASGPTQNLPTTLWFFKEDSGANAITITAHAGDTINGTSSISISTPYQIVQLMSDGVHNWYVNGLSRGSGTPGSPTGTIQVNKNGTDFIGSGTWVYAAGVNGATCDHTADETTAFVALLSTVNAAGGGTISYQCNGLFNSAEITVPVNVRITGLVASANGQWSTPPSTTTSRMDLQYNATDAKLVWLLVGKGEIDHMNLVDTAADSARFILVINTTMAIHDNLFSGTASGTSAVNDAIVLGGTTGTQGNAVTDAFRGYGTYVQHNFFDKIRRGLYMRTDANAVTVKDNTWSSTCGSDNTAAAVHFTTSSAQTSGNIFSGNLYETSNYPYVIWLDGSATKNNLFFGESFWDATATTLFLFHFTNSAAYNVAYITNDASISEAKVTDSQQPAGANSVMDQLWQTGVGLAAIQNRLCSDTSGSGTAQSCNTGTAFTPGAGSMILYHTTTSNSSTSMTINVNSLGAKPVRVAGASGWTATLLTSPASVPGAAGTVPLIPMVYDGTSWNVIQNGTSGSGATVSSFTGDGALLSNSASTGAVTATLANAAAHKFFGNNTAGSAAPGYQTVGPADMTAQAADTILMNATGGSAAPTAVAMPTCTTGAVLYNTSTHSWACVSTGGGGTSDYVNITGSGQVTATGCTQSASTGGKCTISGTSTASVTFSVIPGTYNNLKLYVTTKNTSSASAMNIQFNSDSGSNYSAEGPQTANATNSGIMLLSQTSTKIASIPASTGLVGHATVTIPNYANTTFPKTIISFGLDADSISSGTNNITTTLQGAWNNTAAITSITVSVPANDFANGTIFTLYGEN